MTSEELRAISKRQCMSNYLQNVGSAVYELMCKMEIVTQDWSLDKGCTPSLGTSLMR